MRTIKEKIPNYTEGEIDKFFEALTFNNDKLKYQFENYLSDYDNPEDRLNYVDICEISKYILEKVNGNENQEVEVIFENIEKILKSCDEYIENLVVVGLFESIQNTGNVDYYFGFNKFLKPLSKTKWIELIDYWEGTEWKKTEESKKILEAKNKNSR